MITQERLKKLFDYNLETGWLINRFSRGKAKGGQRASSPTGHAQGYRRVTINYERYYEHQLIWLYVYGEWADEIDHKDGDGGNNSIVNLRLCDRSQNMFNTPQATGESGLRGAYLDKRNLQWYSKIQLGGQQKFLGNFSSAQEAHEAFMYAVELHHGEFAHHIRNTEMEAR